MNTIYHGKHIEVAHQCVAERHTYRFTWRDRTGQATTLTLTWQNGRYREHGANGVTTEALLATIIHRVSQWQHTSDHTTTPDTILHHLQQAMDALTQSDTTGANDAR